jgi:hypothetical protein
MPRRQAFMHDTHFCTNVRGNLVLQNYFISLTTTIKYYLLKDFEILEKLCLVEETNTTEITPV